MPIGISDSVLCASSDGHALGVRMEDIAIVASTAKGAMLMKIEEGERLIGAVLALGEEDTLTVETEKGSTRVLPAARRGAGPPTSSATASPRCSCRRPPCSLWR
jgi:DNA gyrase subunit A